MIHDILTVSAALCYGIYQIRFLKDYGMTLFIPLTWSGCSLRKNWNAMSALIHQTKYETLLMHTYDTLKVAVRNIRWPSKVSFVELC